MQLLKLSLKYIFIVVLMAVSIVARDESFPINGRVLDPNGQAVVQADVSVEDIERGFRTSTVTGSSGEFQLALPTGTYVVITRASGFSEVRQRLTVASGSASRIEIVLPVAGAEATVTVSDGSGYQAEITSTATKTFTSLRDIPQSISVVGRQQIADQQ